jgi:hypothetical protein
MSEPAVENRLPHDADLTQLKLQARELQRSFAAGEADARARVARHMPHRPQAGKLALADAQCTIARSYGFTSWPRLRAHVQWLRSGDERRLEAAVTAVNPHGFTELDTETYVENLETVRSMLRADPGLVHRRFGERQRTLLHQAAWGNGLQLTELLLASGTDPHARDSGGATALSVTLDFGFGREPLAARLAALGPVPDNLRVAAGLGRMERARELLADDAQARQGLWRGNDFVERPLAPTRQALLDDALAYAARSAQLEMMTWLLEEGADVNARPHGGTALHWAAFLGRVEAVRLLLDRGADVTIPDEGNDVRHGTVRRDHRAPAPAWHVRGPRHPVRLRIGRPRSRGARTTRRRRRRARLRGHERPPARRPAWSRRHCAHPPRARREPR